MRVLGVNAIFHDPSAALVVDGKVVAAAEEERFSRRKHGKRPAAEMGLDDPWDSLRQTYAQSAPGFLAAALPGLDREQVRYVPHHVAHAASAALAAPIEAAGRPCSVLVLDGRGEQASHLAGHYEGGRLEPLAAQALPHSLGLLYESLTEHLGFLRSSDEYKVMALASYGRPVHLDALRETIRATPDGGFEAPLPDWSSFAPRRSGGEDDWPPLYADLACSVHARLEELLAELATWLHDRTGDRVLTMAGGTALNCVANSRIWRETAFEEVWVQPAAGDAGTALGAALHVHAEDGSSAEPMVTAALGRQWSG